MYEGYGYDPYPPPGTEFPPNAASFPPVAEWPPPAAVAPPDGLSSSFAVVGDPRFEADLARLLAGPAEEVPATVELPAPAPVRGPGSHRRRPLPPALPVTGAGRLDRLSRTLVVVSVVLVAAIGVLGAVITLAPLRHTADAATGPARWWPVLVQGPWVVASLSILRSSLHRRRALHSWIVVAAFAGLSMALSLTHAPMTVAGVVVAVLPAVATTACLHQLVRQITLTRPPRRSIPGPRRDTPS
ncbi:DUF2637 domain-containing protein (plasmid) [Embleya sp. NBC_00888]|uniref:DUF2637 domain-containing protein n=1 Tax=Embleya sp. NBC_00888 TaxID=2975960 RepID=UPI002F91B44D|nr:DUF2637 domain-containing protein [Embleya sp. NBC_00888]